MAKRWYRFLTLLIPCMLLFSGCFGNIEYTASIQGEGSSFVVEIAKSKNSKLEYTFTVEPAGIVGFKNQSFSEPADFLKDLSIEPNEGKFLYEFTPKKDGKARVTFKKNKTTAPNQLYTLANFDVYVEDGQIIKFVEVVINE